MRSFGLLLVIHTCLLATLVSQLHLVTAYDKIEGSIITVVKTSSSDDVVEENPYYVEPSSSLVDKGRSREKVDAALTKARRKPTRSKLKKHLRKITKSIRRHRMQIFLMIGLYAFRREITKGIWQLISTPVQDAKSGAISRQISLKLNPTAILKIIIFVSIMRQMQSHGEGTSPAALMLLASGKAGNPIISMILSSLLSPQNSAYLPPVQQHYTFERLNDRYEKDGMALQKAAGIALNAKTKSPPVSPSLASLLSRHVVPAYNGTVIVMDLTGLDSSLSQLDSLRDSVSFLLSKNGISSVRDTSVSRNATDFPREEHNLIECEIVILLESPGGSPSEYALASQQIIRMRDQGLKVTVCVDKIAASGGYMIACTASPGQLYAAPFSILGSIGVVGQVVNVHKTLKNWGVDPLIFRAGKDKAPISAIGEVTAEGVLAVQNIVDNTHRAFKRHVIEARPVLEDTIESVATGDIWLGYDAFHRKLIDRIVTSDEYISERISEGARVLKLVKMIPARYPFFRPTVARGIGTRMTSSFARILIHIQCILDRFSSLIDSFLRIDAGSGRAFNNAATALADSSFS